MSTKTCIKCGAEKPEEKFTMHDRKLGKRRNVCNYCRHQTPAFRRYQKKKMGVEKQLRASQKAAAIAAGGGCCEICAGAHRLVVDHRHGDEDPTPRGILCQQCNIGIGFFRDNSDRLRLAARYLENMIA